jgi:hypothetical protein
MDLIGLTELYHKKSKIVGVLMKSSMGSSFFRLSGRGIFEAGQL